MYSTENFPDWYVVREQNRDVKTLQRKIVSDSELWMKGARWKLMRGDEGMWMTWNRCQCLDNERREMSVFIWMRKDIGSPLYEWEETGVSVIWMRGDRCQRYMNEGRQVSALYEWGETGVSVIWMRGDRCQSYMKDKRQVSAQEGRNVSVGWLRGDTSMSTSMKNTKELTTLYELQKRDVSIVWTEHVITVYRRDERCHPCTIRERVVSFKPC